MRHQDRRGAFPAAHLRLTSPSLLSPRRSTLLSRSVGLIRNPINILTTQFPELVTAFGEQAFAAYWQ